jgi:hypothetical protein
MRQYALASALVVKTNAVTASATKTLPRERPARDESGVRIFGV